VQRSMIGNVERGTAKSNRLTTPPPESHCWGLFCPSRSSHGKRFVIIERVLAMKKLLFVSLGVVMAGCATTNQLTASNAKIEELNKRISRIENDLYKVSRTSNVKAVAKSVPPRPLCYSDKAQMVRLNEMMSKRLGVEFGQAPIEGYPLLENCSNSLLTQRVKPVKRFGWFNRWELQYCCNKLVSLRLIADFDRSYSQMSIAEKIVGFYNNIACELGLSQITEYNPENISRHDKLSGDDIGITLYCFNYSAQILIDNGALSKSLSEESILQGKELPSIKTDE